MEDKLNRFKELLAEVFDIYLAANVLEWDQQVNMPPKGAEQRGNQIATLRRLVHTKTIAPEFSRLMEELHEYAQKLDPDSDEAGLIKAAKHFYDRRAKVPPAFTAEFYKAVSLAYSAWQEARQESDFKNFSTSFGKDRRAASPLC